MRTHPHDMIVSDAALNSVIYDFGCNNGDDVAYYLLKGHLVVAVDANPELCRQVEERFAAEIAAGRLKVLNVALAETESSEPITFYVHKHNHVLSRLPEPPADQMHDFHAIQVPCRTPAGIVREFGEPLYVKIDVEHFDQQVLENLFDAGIRPPEISAESHSIQVFATMVANGYNCFSLVEGSTVPEDYRDATISTSEGQTTFSFQAHSAGPFGEDIRARWEDADTFFHTLAVAGLGWKDIHASRIISPDPPATSHTIAKRQLFGVLQRTATSLKARTIGRIKTKTMTG